MSLHKNVIFSKEKKRIRSLIIHFVLFQLSFLSVIAQDNKDQVKISTGLLSGTLEKSGIYSFKGIPYAAPPVENLRWKEPQPAKKWEGILKADKFGNRPMQFPYFNDMNFRSDRMSEDCLYLNVWVPAKKARKLLPVLVYFYGGGFIAGDGSEPRYDGESMATKGIISLTVNYRLDIFGFLAHPELGKESAHHSSGNYGLLDQAAALRWVKQNIAAFGGDPNRITIAGESAGSLSVGAQMVSPQSKKMIAGAIMESGSFLGTLPPVSLQEGEQTGLEFSKTVGANSLNELRALSADSLLKASVKFGQFRFPATIDGYFFPKAIGEILEAGEQSQVPLLAGWNSEEMSYTGLISNGSTTKENYKKEIQKLYNEKADEVFKFYPASNDDEVRLAATDLAGDRLIGFGTWKWLYLHARTGGKKVFRYYYSHPRPPTNFNSRIPLPKGAVHSAEIEYAMGNLSTNKVFAWNDDDYKVSEIMQNYFANFIKTGNPNGPGLPEWPATNGNKFLPVLNIDVQSKVIPAKNDDRYFLLNKIYKK